MNSPPTIALSDGPSAPGGFRVALAAAIRRVTWRVVATTLAISLALEAWFIFDVASETVPQIPAAEAYISGAVVNLLMAFCIMFATLVAEELVARGARRLPVYACAVVAGCAAATLAQWQLHQWLHLRGRYEVAGIPHEVILMQPVATFFEYLIWGGIIVSVYVNRRTAMLAATRMNAAQLERSHAQRRALESRLQALQARVEPQFLFNTLAQVRDLYDHDPPKGGRMLDELIVYLRAALPHLRESNSTLGQELDLVGAYVSIMRVHMGGSVAFEIDVPDVMCTARMPPMILLPLIDHILIHGTSLPGGSGTLQVAARSATGMLRVEIADSGRGFAPGGNSDDLRSLQNRLHALYGDEGTLVFEALSDRGTRAIIEIPYESTHRGHR